MSSPIALGNPLPPSPREIQESRGPRPANVLARPDRREVDPLVVKSAEGMEAMFLDYMMKVMRQTVPKSEMGLENPATEIYQSMMDTEMAQTAARAGGIGLADQIIAYLHSQRYTLPKGHGAPEVARTGGTHEGQSNAD